MTLLEEDEMRRVKTHSIHFGLVILITALLVVSALPFVANITMGLPGYWTDQFDDETKIATKSNALVSGGDVSLGTNGNEWYRHGVVVDSGPPGSGFWKVLHPTVLRDGNGLFRMWFTSRNAAPSIMQRIHYATSTDGKNWNRYGIVMGANASQEDRVYGATVIEDGGTFKMWYVGDDLDPPYGARIFYATSPNGLTWTRQGLVMNIGFEGTYDTSGLNFPWVMKEGSTYKMWYSGYNGANYRILHATSLDGLAWTSQGMIIDLGLAGSPDAGGLIEITIAKDPQGLYHAWYTGTSATGSSVLNATSPDGVTWTKKGMSLRALPGTLEAVVSTGSLMISPTNAVSLWYIGHDGGGIFRIFLANYSKYGYVISESIGPFQNCEWGMFYSNKTDPSADVFVKFTILNGIDWNIIPGYENMSASSASLSSIDFSIYPTIRLKADLWDLLNSPSNTPLLHDWTVTYIDLDDPIFDGLVSAVDDGTGGNITLTWNPASDASTPITYNVYVATLSIGQNLATPDYSTASVGMQVTGLTNGVTYFFIVRAQDAVGNEDDNLMERGAMPTTPIDSTPPDFLGMVTATDSGNGGTVDLTWGIATDPDTIECNTDPTPPITYNIYYATTSFGQNFLLPDATTQNTNIQISGLQDGVDYYFIVRAADAAGNEDGNIAERVVTPTTPLDSTPPDFFGLVTATDTGAGGSVDLSWSAANDPDTPESNSDPSVPITYNVYYATTLGGQNFLTPNAITDSLSAQISGLTNGVTFHFVVRAKDSAGNEDSNLVELSAMPTTPIDTTPPQFSGLLSATDQGTHGNVLLTWSAATDPDTIECNSDPSTPIQYNVHYSTTSGGQDFSTPDQTATGNQAIATGLENGVPYYFVVRAEDAVGNEDYNIIEHIAIPTTPIDSTPPTFGGITNVIVDDDSREVTLVWNVAIDPDEPECNSDPSYPIIYNIYMSEISGSFDFNQPTATTSLQTHPFVDLEREVTYYFTVRAVDAAGNEDENSVSKSGQLAVQEEEFNFLDYWWIFLLIIIVLLLVVIVLLSRKKKGEEPTEETEEEEVEEEAEEESPSEE